MELDHISKAIQTLPPELREMIFKEFIALKIKEKKKWGAAKFIRMFLIYGKCKNGF